MSSFLAEGDVGEHAKGFLAMFPTNSVDDNKVTYAELIDAYYDDSTDGAQAGATGHYWVTDLTITITTNSSSVLAGTFTGTTDENGAGSYALSGSFKLKKI